MHSQKYKRNLDKIGKKLQEKFKKHQDKYSLTLFVLVVLILIKITWLKEVGEKTFFLTTWIILQRSLKLPNIYNIYAGITLGIFATFIALLDPGSLALKKSGDYIFILLSIFTIQEYIKYKRDKKS